MNPVLDYRPCVGIAVFNREGAVWMGRRASGFGSETDGGDKIWQMPQGGIDKGEEPLAAAMRELYEETGIASATLLGQTDDWLTYDLPDHLIGQALKGRYRGQKQKWFAVRFDGEESEIRIDPPPDGHSAEFSDWRWMALQDVPDEIVPFKRPVYEAMVREFAPFAVPSGTTSPG